jgi:NAD(P)-dependent dehydrogenase (short-subunit alcohol dehydrogenase family)
MADLAVICGATGGLGTSIVDALAMRGDRIIAVARSRAEVSMLEAKYPLSSSQGGGVTGETADLTVRQAVDELWERIDRVGVPRWLVNATGGFRGGKVVDTTPDDFTFMMDLNLGSAWWSCRAAARRMQQASASPSGAGPGGGIVNVAARSALVTESGQAAYSVAKAGVIKLTEILAAELKSSGIRVNAVVPAVIDTPANRQSLPEKLIQRAVPPTEIAEVIAFLCSDAALAITGTAIPVYGKF